MDLMPERNLRSAYSLVELLIVIGVLSLLLGLTLPAVQKSRNVASLITCQNNLHQVSLALHNYHTAHGRFPPKRAASLFSTDPDGLLGWMALVLPHLSQDALWRASEEACRIDQLPYRNPPHIGYSTIVREYACTADSRLLTTLATTRSGAAAFTSYIGVLGAPGLKGIYPGVFYGSVGSRIDDIHDGTSNTLMVGERPPPNSLQAGRWYQTSYVLEQFGGPDGQMLVNGFGVSPMDFECASAKALFGPGRLDNPCDRLHYWSLHYGGANFASCDGSVKFLTYSLSAKMHALATRAGGEVVEFP